MRTSDKQRLAEVLLDTPLDSYVAGKRSEGRSWRLITRDIYNDTDGVVDLTEQTLRNWFVDEIAS